MSQIIVLKTNDLNDARLERAVMGRKRFLRVVHKGVPYQDSIEHKIFLLKKELGVSNRPVEHQVRLFGEWKKVSVEKYLECEKAGFAVRIV